MKLLQELTAVLHIQTLRMKKLRKGSLKYCIILLKENDMNIKCITFKFSSL